MMKIETRIDPVEIDGGEISGLPKDSDQVSVSAHWNVNRFVVILFHGVSVTVLAKDLTRAIQNATNHE
jgi:hypothetical protein